MIDQKLPGQTSSDEAIAKVFGHEHSGRVRFLGHGPTPSKYLSSLDSASHNVELVELKSIVKSFVGKVDIIASALQVLIESRCQFQVRECFICVQQITVFDVLLVT